MWSDIYMLNYSCPWSAIITSSAEWLYNDHGDCWVFKQELPRHIHTYTQTNSHGAAGVSAQWGPSKEVYLSQACHWPASSIPRSPVSSLAPIITTSLCLHYMLHPSLPCHAQITLSIRIGAMVCESASAVCVFKGQGRSESPMSPCHFPVDLDRSY